MTEVQAPTEEDAFNFIVQDLQSGAAKQFGYDLYLGASMHRYLESVHGVGEHHVSYFPRISPPFFSAAWSLCRRGILRPGVRQFGQQSTEDGNAGTGYSITPFGHEWLREAAGKYDFVPTEPGRFSQILHTFTSRFGEGFRERSQEAIRCYGAHAYLACCAMCGAAAESIVLALAVAKDGDEEKIVGQYLATGGRGRIEKLLLDSKPEQLKTRFRSYMGLLKYWRDDTSHGMPSGVEDNEAYTSLLLLLQFAQFATDRWSELTE